LERYAYNDLLKWKISKNRKPLLLQGARQVGKTYLVDRFAKKEYSDYFYFNFEKTDDLLPIFKSELDPSVLIAKLSLLTGRKIKSKDTLIFFDEIQVSPEAITSLKYFCEETPEYNIIAAGSLLGVSVGKKSSFPVGKVNFMNMYPMNFIEFLKASGDGLLSELITGGKMNEIIEVFHNRISEKLKLFMYLGGMPEVLQAYLKNQDILEARKIQMEIIKAYKNDFSKYSDSSQAVKTAEVWDSLPYQLSKENKKFKYGDAAKNARSSTYGLTITWLKNAGLVYPAYNVSAPKIPLAGYSDKSKFKLYMLDTGLLGAMLGISSDIILKPGELFSHYNGAFTENLVASELVNSGYEELYYWTSEGKAEVDFLLKSNDRIYPLEVKGGMNKNLKSLRVYETLYKPEKIIRTSPRIFSVENEFINIPLYAVSAVEAILKDGLYKTLRKQQ
jgi:uncharacterized protein